MLSPLGEDSNPFALTPTVFPVKTGLYSRTGRVTKVTLLTIMFNYAYEKKACAAYRIRTHLTCSLSSKYDLPAGRLQLVGRMAMTMLTHRHGSKTN